jgi:AraC family transcriptional regulator
VPCRTSWFELDDVRERMSDDIVLTRELQPRRRFSDDGIWQLGRLLAEECRHPQPGEPLYAESLLVALFARLGRAGRAATEHPRRGGLTARQLARVMESIESNTSEAISLKTLAALTSLSVSHFCHAFKVSMGLSPHRWQLDARVRRAQQLLVEGQLSVSDVAFATGFADQSHLTRVFRRLTGATPAAWRRERSG